MAGAAGGPACPDDCKGLCVGGACCDLLRACGEVCCGQGQVCSFNQCVTPTKSCLDVSECAPTEFCDTRLGEATGQGGAGGTCTGSAAPGKCLPRPPVCPGGEPPPSDKPVTCVGKCEVKPTPAPFEVELKYAWGGEVTAPYSTDVMMTPIVIQLDDDDCDGQITARDIPEIVFSTFTGGGYTQVGTLHAISIVGGKVVDKWSVPGIVQATAELAAGDLDGLPGNEIVACGQDGHIYALNGKDGSVLWMSPEKISCRMPAIADLDQDGKPEIIESGAIVSGQDGSIKAAHGAGGLISVSDMDGDGKLEIVSGARIVRADGTTLSDGQFYGSYSAVGDLDKDGIPEVVAAVPGQHKVGIWHLDANDKTTAVIVRTGIDINAPFDPLGCGMPLKPDGTPVYPDGYPGGGPPTVADFNGDGFPDVALAGGLGYVVLDGKKVMDPSVADKDTILWFNDTQDCSSVATGSSIFDFNGDGQAEVLYGDEIQFRIYDGPTGKVLFETCNTSGTLIEYPVVADVDGDDQADIIVASNAYAFGCNGVRTAGIRVFGSKNRDWVRTRRVWNEHAYHVTNVNEDGSIPAVEPINWQQPGLNNFRQNKQPGSEFSAPDAIVSLLAPRCDKAGDFEGLVATVRNVGEAVLPAGVTVSFYAGTPPAGKLVGQGYTTLDLYPAQGQDVTVLVSDADLASGKTPAYAVVDDAGEPHPLWTECRTDNNTSIASAVTCGKF